MFVKKQDLPKTELYQLRVVDRFAVSCCVKDFKLLSSFFFVALVHDVQDHLYDSYDSTLECIEAQSKHLAVNSNIERTTTGASQFCQKRLKGFKLCAGDVIYGRKIGFHDHCQQ